MTNIMSPMTGAGTDLPSTVRRIYEGTKAQIERSVAHYGGTMKDVLETRHWEKLDSILDAQSREEALRIAEAAKEKVDTTLLSMWATKKIPGPNTPENLESKAKKAEGLVKMQVKRGNTKAAEKQRQRVNELRAKAGQLRAGQAPTQEAKKPRRRTT